jgi:hypothetical protein
MVDLLRAPVDHTGRMGRSSIGSVNDLVGERLRGLDWLLLLPAITQIVIAENGYPARFVVPDPRLFALHKLWVSLQPTRAPIKRKRDLRQGEAVAELSLEYLNLPFDDRFCSALPPDLKSMLPGLEDRLAARRSNSGERNSGLPPGFVDAETGSDEE